MNTLVHITPQLPPAIDGVGDYCWNLWKQSVGPLALRADDDQTSTPRSARLSTSWKFLVARRAQDTLAFAPELDVREFGLNAEALTAALAHSDPETIVLHYVGYAYQPKGVPVWLPEALREWRLTASNRSRRLVTMFHEMYARSSPLRSPFWVAPIARKIIRELVEMSDTWLTSCDRYWSQLTNEFQAEKRRGRIIPIPSNVPAPAQPSAKAAAEKIRIAIFGLAKTRVWALERHWRFMQKLAHAGAIEHVTLLGQRPSAEDERAIEKLAAQINSGLQWRKRFDLSVAEISAELQAHEVGLLANEPDILTKSGVFAALAGHGVVPVVSIRGARSPVVSLREAVIANDDAALLNEATRLARPSEQLNARRERLVEFAHRDLSWRGVAQSWREVLERNSPRAPEPLDSLVTLNRQEVPA
jgi:hypothetical protein